MALAASFEISHYEHVLRGGPDAWVALERLQRAVEEREAAGDEKAPGDLLILATGFLRREPRFLQEYLRAHEEKVPFEIRARMNDGLARMLAEASRRNAMQAFVRIHVDLIHPSPCRLWVNGQDRGAFLEGSASLASVPGVPLRLHAVCGPEGDKALLHSLATFTPPASSAESRVRLNAPTKRTALIEKSQALAPALAAQSVPQQNPNPAPHAFLPFLRTPRVGFSSSVVHVGSEYRLHGLRSAPLRPGMLVRVGLQWNGELFHLNADATRATQLRPESGAPEAELSSMRAREVRTAFSLGAGAAAALGEPGTVQAEFGATISAWRWVCAHRPCGFYKQEPAFVVSAGIGALIPFAGGSSLEFRVEPGLILGLAPRGIVEARAVLAHAFPASKGEP